MSVWRRERPSIQPSEHALRILNEVDRGLLVFDPRPVVTSIRIGAGIHDLHDFEVEVELAPGATLAIRYQSVDEEDRRPDDLQIQDSAVVWHVIESVCDFHAEGPDALAEVLHDLRVRTRRTLADWSASGAHATLLDIRFVRTEFWAMSDALQVEARLRTLDERLQPAVFALSADHPDELEAALAACRPKVAARYAARDALARYGADGWVDRLVLNATPRHWTIAEALRGTFAGWAGHMPGELDLFMYEGHIQCHGRSLDDGISWNRNSLVLHERQLPAATCRLLRGRPVTQVLRHAVTSDDMIIKDVSSVCDRSGRKVIIEFEQPRLVFCGASGRFWAPGEDTAAGSSNSTFH